MNYNSTKKVNDVLLDESLDDIVIDNIIVRFRVQTKDVSAKSQEKQVMNLKVSIRVQHLFDQEMLCRDQRKLSTKPKLEKEPKMEKGKHYKTVLLGKIASLCDADATYWYPIFDDDCHPHHREAYGRLFDFVLYIAISKITTDDHQNVKHQLAKKTMLNNYFTLTSNHSDLKIRPKFVMRQGELIDVEPKKKRDGKENVDVANSGNSNSLTPPPTKKRKLNEMESLDDDDIKTDENSGPFVKIDSLRLRAESEVINNSLRHGTKESTSMELWYEGTYSDAKFFAMYLSTGEIPKEMNKLNTLRVACMWAMEPLKLLLIKNILLEIRVEEFVPLFILFDRHNIECGYDSMITYAVHHLVAIKKQPEWKHLDKKIQNTLNAAVKAMRNQQ